MPDRARGLRVIGEQPAGADRRPNDRRRRSDPHFYRRTAARGRGRSRDAGGCHARAATRSRSKMGVEPGEFVRRQGGDLAAGQKILAPRRPDRGAEHRAARFAGLAEIEVGALPRVAIVSTGDELARLGETPRPGQIFESNAIMLRGARARAGAKIATGRARSGRARRFDATLRRGLEGRRPDRERRRLGRRSRFGAAGVRRARGGDRSLAGRAQTGQAVSLRPAGGVARSSDCREIRFRLS